MCDLSSSFSVCHSIISWSPSRSFRSPIYGMSAVRLKPLLHQPPRDISKFRSFQDPRKGSRIPRLKCYQKSLLWNATAGGYSCCRFNPRRVQPIRAGTAETSLAEAQNAEVLFRETFPLKWKQTVEGKISVKFQPGKEKDRSKMKLVVGCDLEGQWVLHWGVTYSGVSGSEWDQPPPEMRPPGSIAIKDYAIETPLKKASSLEGQIFHEVQIDLDSNSSIAAIHFVLKEENMGAWFQHRGRDFRIPVVDYLQENDISVGAFTQISSLRLIGEGSGENGSGDNQTKAKNWLSEAYSEEYPIFKEELVQNFMTISVMKSTDTDENLVHFDTDTYGNVVVHWGVCRDNGKKWEVPTAPHPPESQKFREKAVQTLLQPKENGRGSWGLFTLSQEFSGLLFVLKLNEGTWLNNMGSDFYIPLIDESRLPSQTSRNQTGDEEVERISTEPQDMKGGEKQGVVITSPAAYTDEIIKEIRNLVTDISSDKGNNTKSKAEQESILHEIEKLAAEAYSIFRGFCPSFVEESVSDADLIPPSKLHSGTGSGYEILCQGFNWESHKSGRWYSELFDKADELSNLGFTIIWLPPPTESVSPEGYMPNDLYNLNSRYGNMEELKDLVRRFHKVGIKVLGDAVLNHRCAHYQNKNGIWNIFGGRLKWDDRAVVADDPHFQGRGNKSSGDNFHAAPNIDHSQDFVRKDLKEWLCWLRKEIGYDGWRLDFVRGFWGGYVKDYLDASEPYFAVGEYWDSLSYTYGEMDHNQDAHRQKIIDWINATNGTAGAFDVTTKGILHTALEKCEYWRLSDDKGKPPGVVGWWPSRAVTFIENHDTGSTQGHWRFPSGKEMQGYAYILTHPGTPTVFYDHIFSHYKKEISMLIAVRNKSKIHCRSTVKITKAERDVYAAVIDKKIAMKIGPGSYEPPTSPRKWILAAEGKDYKVWEVSPA